MVDASGVMADEGRGRPRKAVGSCQQALIHRYPNGETRFESYRSTVGAASVVLAGGTGGTETSQYPEEKKSTV